MQNPLALTLALGAALAGCSQAAEAAVPQPVPVKVHTVAAESGDHGTRYAGTLEPAVRVELAFRIAGYLDTLGVTRGQRALDKGDRVTKGTVLARLRSTEYQQKRSTADAQAGEARATVRLAGDELVRARRLFDSGAITRAELDAKGARADTAGAQLAAAVARAEEADLAVSDTQLRAPLDGVVLERKAEVGSLIAAGQPVFTLVDTRTVKAVFGAPHGLIERLRIGSPLQVVVGGLAREAHVTRIAPAADGMGRVFAVEAELPNPAGELRAGAVVSVHVPEARDTEPLTVPLAAIVRSARAARGFAVYVLEGEGARGRVAQRDVTLGEVLGNAVSVRAGVHAGERIVSMGASLLRDGTEAVVVR